MRDGLASSGKKRTLTQNGCAVDGRSKLARSCGWEIRVWERSDREVAERGQCGGWNARIGAIQSPDVEERSDNVRVSIVVQTLFVMVGIEGGLGE